MLLRRSSKNNVLAGLFLLFSLSLALVVFFLLSSTWERWTVHTERYIVAFTLSDGASGLVKGAPVQVGGAKVGTVTSWSFAKDSTTDQIIGVDVEIEVRSEIRLYENAIAYLVLPLLGSSSVLNFPFVGDPRTVVKPQHDNPRLEPGERIEGRLAPPAFLTQAGYGPDQTKQVQSIIRNAEETTIRLNSVSKRVEDKLKPLFEQVEGIMADTKAISGDAKESFAQWRVGIQETLDRLKLAADKLTAVIDGVMLGIAETRGVIASVQGTVDTNKDTVARTLTNIEELTQKLKTDAFTAILEILDNGKKGTAEFASSAEKVRVLLGRRGPDIETIIANARLASDQLKLATIEIRQAPWKLLAKPEGRRDLENEVLYDSVRAYATAVADLRAAAVSLESMTSGDGKPSDLDRRTIDEITKSIKESFERYQKAEKDFLKKWSEAGNR